MFKKSLLLCWLAASFCFVQARGVSDKMYAGMQKAAVMAVNTMLEVALTESPFPSSDEHERLKYLRNLLINLQGVFERGQHALAFSKDANGVVVTSSAAAMSLAATYVKRSRALRIGGFVIPLFGAYCVMSSKFLYYAFQALREETEGRVRQIDWQLKNSRP